MIPTCHKVTFVARNPTVPIGEVDSHENFNIWNLDKTLVKYKVDLKRSLETPTTTLLVLFMGSVIS
jgi:hypothetical protein